MAIHTSFTRTDFPSDGVQTRFAILFPCHDVAHLRVTRVLPSGTEAELVLGIDYQAEELEPPEVGTWAVTLEEPLPAGYTLRVRRILPLTQPLALRTQGQFSPAVIEDALDHLEMQIQQLNDGVITADTVAGGELNQAANANTRGIGVYKNKAGQVLRFKGIEAASEKIVVAEDAASSTIQVDLGTVEPGDVGAAPAALVETVANHGDRLDDHATEIAGHELRITDLEGRPRAVSARGDYRWNGSAYVRDSSYDPAGVLPAMVTPSSPGVVELVFATPLPTASYRVGLSNSTTTDGRHARGCWDEPRSEARIVLLFAWGPEDVPKNVLGFSLFLDWAA